MSICRIWALLSSAGAAVAATAAFTSTAHCNKFTDGIQNARKRQFFKYEKRLRQKSTHEKMFEYFSSEVTDGKHCMTAHDILRALIAVYPPDDATWSRSGSLDGERAPQIKSVRSTVLHDPVCSLVVNFRELNEVLTHPVHALSLFSLCLPRCGTQPHIVCSGTHHSS